jgi:hypothetical protein
LGTDGNYHLSREWVWQQPSNLDTSANVMLRGYMPGAVSSGFGNLGANSILDAGSEKYIRQDVNLGFWAGAYALGHCIRYA